MVAISNNRHSIYDLKLRINTSLALVLIAIFFICFASFWMLPIVVTFLILLAMFEYVNLILCEATIIEKMIGLFCAVLLPWIIIIWGIGLFGAFVFISSILTCVNLLTSGELFFGFFKRIVKYCWGIIYIGGGLCSLLIIANQNYGRSLVLFAISIVVAADSGAYFIGYFFGKHKMIPSLSPGKTWEGCAGGLILASVIGYLVINFCLPDISIKIGIFLGFFLGIMSIIGDLLESKLKRIAKAKDSGSLLPGHGGILDRVDGILFTSPILLICREFWW